MDASPIELGAELRRLRHQLGLTQRQVAQRLGGHFVERDIQRIEAGFMGRLPLYHMQTLLQVFGKDLTYLTHGTSTVSADRIPATGSMISVPWSEGARVPALAEARARLQLARQSSQEAYQRSNELLHACHELAERWALPRHITPAVTGSSAHAR